MDKFKTWFPPILIVLLALAALVYFRGPWPHDGGTFLSEISEKGRKGFAKSPELTVQQKAKSDSEAMVTALNSGKVEDCKKITWNENLEQQCEDNLNFAAFLKSGDERQCEEIIDISLKNQCYNRIYLSLAVDGKDASLCEKISDPTLKQMCLDQVQMILGRYAKSEQDCTSIVSEELRNQCKDYYFLQSSTSSLSTQGCDRISDKNILDQCKKTVAKNTEVIAQSKRAAETAQTNKTLQEILSLCDELTGSKAVTCKDAIYPQLAFDKKDLSFCEKVSDQTKADQCKHEQGDRINEYYLRESMASNDKSFCGQISDSALKELCLNS